MHAINLRTGKTVVSGIDDILDAFQKEFPGLSKDLSILIEKRRILNKLSNTEKVDLLFDGLNLRERVVKILCES